MFCRDGKGEIMNRFYGVFRAVNFARAVFALCAIVACGLMPVSAYSAAVDCMTSSAAYNITSCDGFPCACPTGETATTYSCPSGWIYDSMLELCTRSSSTGTDSTGTYTQNYGTCSPSTSSYDCYTTAMSDSGSCMCRSC